MYLCMSLCMSVHTYVCMNTHYLSSNICTCNIRIHSYICKVLETTSSKPESLDEMLSLEVQDCCCELTILCCDAGDLGNGAGGLLIR